MIERTDRSAPALAFGAWNGVRISEIPAAYEALRGFGETQRRRKLLDSSAMTSAALTTAMIERCRDMIREHVGHEPDLAEPLRRRQLIAMCNRLIEHIGEWPDVRIHRWIGFVQAGMLANGIVDLEGAKSMFLDARKAFGESSADVLDHLDPDDTFELDIGGQG